MKYHNDQVCVCELAKPSNFLHFRWLDYGSELEHLKHLSESDKAGRVKEVLAMKAAGESNTSIAQHFGVSEGAVRHWLKKNIDS